MRDCKPIDTVERTTILAGLLAGDERPPNPFGDADLAALWVHQMGASVATALREGSSDALAKPTEQQQALDRHGITSFFDLFEHPAPPAVIMAEVRRYARQLMTLGADEFPRRWRARYPRSPICARRQGRAEARPAKGRSAPTLDVGVWRSPGWTTEPGRW